MNRSFAFYALLLGAFMLMMPLGTDIFLPAMPAFAKQYGVSMGQAEFTLSAFFAGSALGQIVWGPASDRFGRKPVILVAVSAYFCAAAAVALSDSFAPVIFWRFVQGIAAASGRIVGNAIARDRYERERLAQLIAIVMTIGGISSTLTGPIGGFLADRFDWQAAFVVTAAYGALLLLLIAFVFKETIAEKNPLAINPVPMATTMAMIARSGIFRAYVLLGGAAMAGLSAFLNSAPGLLISVYGLSPSTFGLMFASLPLGFLVGSVLVARFGARVSGDVFLMIGSACTTAGGLTLLGFAIFGLPHPYLLVLPMMPYLFGFAFLIPQAASGALSPFGRVAGTASSLQGFIQSMFGAGVSAVLGFANNGTLYPLAIAIAIAGCATMSVYLLLVRPLRRASARSV